MHSQPPDCTNTLYTRLQFFLLSFSILVHNMFITSGNCSYMKVDLHKQTHMHTQLYQKYHVYETEVESRLPTTAKWCCVPVSNILGYFPHELSRRSPGIIIGGFPHLGFDFWVVHYNIGAVAKQNKTQIPFSKISHLMLTIKKKTISELTVLLMGKFLILCVWSGQDSLQKRNMHRFPLDIFNPIMTTLLLLRRSAKHAFPHA